MFSSTYVGGNALFTHFRLMFGLHTGALRACALNKALDASLYSYVILKAYTPSLSYKAT